MQPLVSVIIPVYNCEKYLSKCISSVIAQSYRTIEIILVDDGSNDKSGSICDEYAKRDNRIQIIHQKNRGVSHARNVGLCVAHGEYFCFVDSDDWITKDSIEKLFTSTMKYSSDMSYGNMTFVEPFHSLQFEFMPKEEKCFLLSDHSAVAKYLADEWFGPCRRLFRMDIQKQNNIFFDETVKVYEDEMFVLTYLGYCQKVSIVPESIYFYNRLSTQTATKNQLQHKELFQWIIKSSQLWIDLFHEEKSIESSFAIQKRCLNKWYFSCISCVKKTDKKIAIEKLFLINAEFKKMIDTDIANNNKNPKFDLFLDFTSNPICEKQYNYFYETVKKENKNKVKIHLQNLASHLKTFRIYSLNKAK